ncbi:MAG: hypothetical protein AAB250_15780 [Bdellovibrionota bacterium]
MTGPRERGEGRGSKEAAAKVSDQQVDQIEYLLYQSTQGLHFIFDHSEVAKVLKSKAPTEEPLTLQHMEKVQGLLSSLLDRKAIDEKKSFLESLSGEDYELLVRAYFQLVDKAILANSTLRH